MAKKHNLLLSKLLLISTLFGCLLINAKPAGRSRREVVYLYAGDPELGSDHGNLWEGDMIVTDAEGIETDDNWLSQKTVRFHQVSLWNDGIVPYAFDVQDDVYKNSALTEANRNEVRAAMNDLERLSCVRFVERSSDDSRPFVHIRGPPKEKNLCAATVGMRPHAGNTLLLGPACFSKRGYILHQLLHILSLYHEHTRTDRHNFIDIERKSLTPPEAQQNYLSYVDPDVNNANYAYDYNSIMHYPTNAYTDSTNRNTFYTTQLLTNGAVVGQRERLSATDIAKLNTLYSCPQVNNNTNNQPGTNLQAVPTRIIIRPTR